jgi:hypothetical protein
MHGQFDLEFTSKSNENSQIEFNFHEFWSEEYHSKK